MKLIATLTSPYARKVRIVMAEKRIECDLQVEPVGVPDSPVFRFNPLGKVPVLLLDDGTAIDDGRILDYAPSYRLSPLAAELWDNPRPWTYKLDFNETDSRILALEYYELGECVRSGARPEVTGEDGRDALELADRIAREIHAQRW